MSIKTDDPLAVQVMKLAEVVEQLRERIERLEDDNGGESEYAKTKYHLD